MVLKSQEQAESTVARLRGTVLEFGGLERLVLLLDALEPRELAEVNAALFREDLRGLAQDIVQRKRRGELNEDADWDELWAQLPLRIATFLLHALAPDFESRGNVDSRGNVAETEPASLRRAFSGRMSIVQDMLHLVRPQANQPKHIALAVVAPRLPKSKLL